MTNPNDLINPAHVDYGPDDRGYTHDGLTKREYFAAKAMQGIIANPTSANNSRTGAAFSSAIAEAAVMMADALINALNKKDQS